VVVEKNGPLTERFFDKHYKPARKAVPCFSHNLFGNPAQANFGTPAYLTDETGHRLSDESKWM
jgi:hypothetical protein